MLIDRELNIPKEKHFFLFGPRQTGKTSLIKSKFTQLLNINLLSHQEYLKYITNPHILYEEVLSLGSEVKYILIDEIQRVPELLNEVHSLIEEQIEQKFILTGSSARKLKRGGANLLGGRARNLTIFPFTYFELKEKWNLEKILNYGSIPGIYLQDKTEDLIEDLRSYTEVYLEEEIKAEAVTRNIGGFIRFLKLAAQCNAEQVNFSNIARDANINPVSVKEYFQILSDTLIGNFLMPFHFSERKKHKLSPKFYFFDTGVVRAIEQKLSLKLEKQSYEYGKYFETLIINEVTRINSYLRKDWKLSFLRTSNDVEVDLVIETPRNDIYGIEIKSKEVPEQRDFQSGFKALKSLVPNAKCYCVSGGNRNRKLDGIEIMTVLDFFEFLRTL